jgi:hypothetical protein
MKLVRTILISLVAGLVSAIVGWFAGDAIGLLLELRTDHSLGTGLPTVWLMCVLAFGFGLVGFTVCLGWHLRSRLR